jgi:hypothetical protein
MRMLSGEEHLVAWTPVKVMVRPRTLAMELARLRQ